MKFPQEEDSGEQPSLDKEEELESPVQQNIGSRYTLAAAQITRSPYPPPEDCQKYEEILPGFTDRVLNIAETAQRADIQSRKRADNYTLIWRLTSVILAFLLASLTIGGAIFLLNADKKIAGLSVLITAVAGIVVALLGKKNG